MNVSLDKDFIYEYKLQGYKIEKDENSEEQFCDDYIGVNFCYSDDSCNEPIKTNETEVKSFIIQEKGEASPINNFN